MDHFRTHLCAICGEERFANQPRFLVTENTWEDKLTILQWNERVGIQVARGIDHVEELVIHWMTTGSLDHPYARTALGSTRWRRSITPSGRADLSGARPIGELAVHRESIERVLAENPQSLRAVLDALLDALCRETKIEEEPVPRRESEPESERKEALCAVSTEPEY